MDLFMCVAWSWVSSVGGCVVRKDVSAVAL